MRIINNQGNRDFGEAECSLADKLLCDLPSKSNVKHDKAKPDPTKQEVNRS